MVPAWAVSSSGLKGKNRPWVNQEAIFFKNFAVRWIGGCFFDHQGA